MFSLLSSICFPHHVFPKFSTKFTTIEKMRPVLKTRNLGGSEYLYCKPTRGASGVVKIFPIHSFLCVLGAIFHIFCPNLPPPFCRFETFCQPPIANRPPTIRQGRVGFVETMALFPIDSYPLLLGAK